MTLKLTRVTSDVTSSPTQLVEYVQNVVKDINDARIAKRRLIRVNNVTSTTAIRLASPGFQVGGLVIAQIRRIDAAHTTMSCFANWVQGQDGMIRVDLDGLTVGAKYNVTFEVIENG